VEDRKVGPFIKTQIDGMRSGKIEDKHGWIVPVQGQAVNV
jgi:branched-chain amino acid aminotransferase